MLWYLSGICMCFAQHLIISFIGDLVENYCHNDDLMNAARFCFAVTVMLTYPIEAFVTREVRSVHALKIFTATNILQAFS